MHNTFCVDFNTRCLNKLKKLNTLNVFDNLTQFVCYFTWREGGALSSCSLIQQGCLANFLANVNQRLANFHCDFEVYFFIIYLYLTIKITQHKIQLGQYNNQSLISVKSP